MPPRDGVLAVAPGDTRFHPIALRSIAGGKRLEGAVATPERFAEEARKADVVVYFGHAKHRPFLGAELNLAADGRQRPRMIERYPEHWAGMERVELWAGG
jgi:hypothetical protein